MIINDYQAKEKLIFRLWKRRKREKERKGDRDASSSNREIIEETANLQVFLKGALLQINTGHRIPH